MAAEHQSNVLLYDHRSNTEAASEIPQKAEQRKASQGEGVGDRPSTTPSAKHAISDCPRHSAQACNGACTMSHTNAASSGSTA